MKDTTHEVLAVIKKNVKKLSLFDLISLTTRKKPNKKEIAVAKYALEVITIKSKEEENFKEIKDSILCHLVMSLHNEMPNYIIKRMTIIFLAIIQKEEKLIQAIIKHYGHNIHPLAIRILLECYFKKENFNEGELEYICSILDNNPGGFLARQKLFEFYNKNKKKQREIAEKIINCYRYISSKKMQTDEIKFLQEKIIPIFTLPKRKLINIRTIDYLIDWVIYPHTNENMARNMLNMIMKYSRAKKKH